MLQNISIEKLYPHPDNPEARFRYEDIDGLIEELLAIKNMRSA